MSDTQLFDAEDKKALSKTSQLRDQMITEMTKKGIPSDEKERKFLLDVLDSADRSVFNKARIRVDEKNGQNQQQTTAMIAAVLLKINEQQIISNTREAREKAIPKELPDPKLIPGETAIGVQNQTYDQFMQRMEN